MKRRHFVLTAAGIFSFFTMVVTITAAAGSLSAKTNQTDDARYQESVAEYGLLTVGITGTSSVSPQITEQKFGIDIGEMTGGIPAALKIEEVLVSAGQQVRKGTPLFRVTQDSARYVRKILQEKILETNRTCELLEAGQKALYLRASQEYERDIMDGKYAAAAYSSRCNALQKKADEAKENVDSKQNQVNQTLLELTQAQQELTKAQKYLKEAEAAVVENYDRRYQDAYYYTVYGNTREAAQNMVTQWEETIENLTRKNETLLYEVDEAVRAHHQIVQELEKEKLAAGMDRDIEIYGSETASENYDIRTAGLDDILQEARQQYQIALQNIRMFDAGIARGEILSGYNGVVADVLAEPGDMVSGDDALVLLYDQDAVTMQVLLSEEDGLAIRRDEAANITFSAVPDVVYEGRITKMPDMAFCGESAEPCYEVTVTLQGDVAGLCAGMTGDVTFLTGQAVQALCVPRGAVYTEGRRSCVKVRDEDGKIREKNVTTGITDGIYIEIIKGISQGDIVLVADDGGVL